MLREKLFSPLVREELKTEWRSREISRVEGFSDAVFGFAVTLLIVSLEVPRTSAELLEAMKGFGAFLITFAILFSIWYKQFLFFRKYGLEDRTAVVLNGALLVVVLFFVYPLKFMAGYLVNRALGLGKLVTLADGSRVPAIAVHDFPTLLAIYAFGFSAVFAVFALLYRHAYSKRDEIALSPVESYDTLDSLRLYVWIAVVGFVLGAGTLLSSLGGWWGTQPAQLGIAAIELAAVARMLRFRLTRAKRRNLFLTQLSAK